MSAVVKLMPKPPARVVSKKMNFSLPGLLYSSMATIRSSCAVLPSIRQYSKSKLTPAGLQEFRTYYIVGKDSSLPRYREHDSSD